MNTIRPRPAERRPHAHPEEIPGARESKLSRNCLWWIVAAPLVGFALAGRVLELGAEGDWEPWKAAVLGALLMTPFAVGAYFGLRSVLKGFRGGWMGLAANLALAALAIGMPIGESLTS
ncbi:MAG TPA: hypothetical protein VJ913_09650 [Actinomycetota bacterium]|nr:hypothetical protein [Actinomycetota bacterium]